MTMLERAARAMFDFEQARIAEFRANPAAGACACLGPRPYCPCERHRAMDLARAAIKAMREPTDALLDGFYEPIKDTAAGSFLYDEQAKECWRSAMDSILNES